MEQAARRKTESTGPDGPWCLKCDNKFLKARMSKNENQYYYCDDCKWLQMKLSKAILYEGKWDYSHCSSEWTGPDRQTIIKMTGGNPHPKHDDDWW